MQRTLKLENRLTSVAPKDRFSGNQPKIVSSLVMDFIAPAPVEWIVEVEDVQSVREEEGKLEIRLDGSTRLTLSGENPPSVTPGQEPGTVKGRFPLGEAGGRITIQLECSGHEIVAEAAVLCRPSQLIEAAVALSAVPGKGYVPLIVVEPSDLSDQDHDRAYQEYRGLVEFTLQSSGQLGRRDLQDDPERTAEFVAKTIRRRQLLKTLASRRSLAKRNLLLRLALQDLGVRKALILFDAPPGELAIAAPETEFSKDKKRSEETLLPPGSESIRIQCADPISSRTLRDFAGQCAQALGRDPSLSSFVTARAANVADVLVALHRARLSGALLALPDSPSGEDDGSIKIAGPEAGNGHVVLVEAQDDSKCLVGALFAAHLGARLVVRPTSDLAGVKAAVDSMQHAILRYGSPIQDDSGSAPVSTRLRETLFGRLSAAAREVLFNDKRRPALRDLYRAVAEAIPTEVRSAIGEAQLTAFTPGLPYHLLCDGNDDWSGKPIGHIIADPDLQILGELASQATLDPLVSFNVILDPGFFEHSETDDVEASLKGRPSRTLVIRVSDTTRASFAVNLSHRLLNSLPVEFVLFNTHGSDEGLMLGNYELHASAIPQWMQFAERPIIFNNSCISWYGVGRQFVRVGSRAYIGTLWSVEARDAATTARSIMTDVTQGGATLSSAMARARATGGLNLPAYLIVGTALARFPDPARYRAAGSAASSIAELNRLLVILENSRNDNDDEGAAAYIYESYLELRRRLAELQPRECAHAIIQLILREVKLLLKRGLTLNLDNPTLRAILNEGETVLGRGSLEMHEERRLSREILLTSATLMDDAGDVAAGVKIIRELLRTGDADEQFVDKATVTLIDQMIGSGAWDEAFALAEAMRDAARAKGDRAQLLLALGRVAQVAKRLPKGREAGIAAAVEGEALALELDSTIEQAAMATDLAHHYMLSKRFAEAVPVAERALAFARQSGDTTAEIAAYGTLGNAYERVGDLVKARRMAEIGLDRAIALKLPQRINVFMADLARVSAAAGPEAQTNVEHLAGRLETLERTATTMHMPFRLAFLADLIDLAFRSGDAVSVVRATLQTPACLTDEEEELGQVATTVLVALARAGASVDASHAASQFALLRFASLELLGKLQAQGSGPRSLGFLWALVADAATILGLAAGGEVEEALAQADKADEGGKPLFRGAVERLLGRAPGSDDSA
ncbi:MAG TPA: tetratricopeptide repeat protein [Allosphingosinicella sp.]|nr:tetratricopeptide repeat protein [Allosphingosinicella sp.]